MELMRRLLVVSDLHMDPPGRMVDRGAGVPQLPALCELLRLGKAGARHRDWRAGLASDLGAAALADAAPGSVVACGVASLAPGSSVCMAEPVSLIAGMASVHLHPAGLVDLSHAETDALLHGFDREFGAANQRLHAAGTGLLLQSPVAPAASSPDPAGLLGSALEISPAQDAAQRDLRRLGVEVEMWLSGLPLNREREKRGELPVSALWFWGGGARKLPDARDARGNPWAHAYGSDPWLLGCWKHLVGTPVLTAEHWDAIDRDPALVVVSAARRSSLAQLESAWFVPALRDLRAGRMAALALRIGGRSWDIGAQPRWRWWRRSRPWWQVLAA